MKRNIMKRFMFFALTLLCLFTLNAQQTKLLTAEKHNEYGLIYTLPITAFRIEVVAVKEVSLAGPFSKYSKIFTNDAKIITEDAVNWTIESVKVTPYGIPDSENRYLMQLKAGATTFIGVADDGMLLSINKEPELQPLEILDIVKIEGVKSSGKEYLEYVNEDFISAISSYKKAQLLAEEIMEIRDAKLSLTRGTAETMPTDGRQLEIMLESLENQERALTYAFTGSSWKERMVSTFNFIPENEGKNIICKVNPSEGITGADKKDGKPLYVSISLTDEARLPVDTKGEEKKVPKDAVMYCIPGFADLSLYYENKNIFSKEFPMSQFGLIYGLNPSIFTDKKEPSYAVFDSTTGALKELGTVKQ